MNNDTQAPSMNDFWAITKWGLLAVAAGFLIFLALHALGVVGTVASAPGRVVSKTLGTDNIISSYEWFYDVNAQFEARSSQIAAHAGMLSAEDDKKERSRLNIELSAMRQSCRDLAAKYNANSQKANKSLFKSNNLPEVLSPNTCEAAA